MVASASSTDNRGPAVLVVTIALLVLSTIFIVLRLISRIGVVKKISKDDYFIVLAWVCRIRCAMAIVACCILKSFQLIALGMSISICNGTSLGLGQHEVDVKPQHRNALKKCQYTFSVLYVNMHTVPRSGT